MNTKTLSHRALSVIDQYLHLKVGPAVCSTPYVNNKAARRKASLRATIGKGSVHEIIDEVNAIIISNHLSTDSLSNESLKKLLADSGIGIDCSGFAYYVLDAESQAHHKGALNKHITFVRSGGVLGKIRSSLRPIENCDVATLSHEKNSVTVPLDDVRPGDMITMLGGRNINPDATLIQTKPDSPVGKPEPADHDHVLVIHQVEYQDSLPKKIHYSHAIAYPEDGIYNSGVRQGIVEIIDLKEPISRQRWIESGFEGAYNRLFARAQRSKTELRRLLWL